jgi:hypothetical protein
MEPDKTTMRKKPYSKPNLKLLDPQQTLAKIKAAAQTGDSGAQMMLDRIGALDRRSQASNSV